MASDATLQSIPTTHVNVSSTAWFWWKETRQLAPLVCLLAVVAISIVVLNSAWGMVSGGVFRFRLPYAVTMLVFPGLLATGAGPLLVGQERSQRTLNWLVLLPVSAKRIVTTKLAVALTGLAVMWAFAFLMVALFDLSSPTSEGSWLLGNRKIYSQNPFSYPVWISHSIFVLLAGFYVAWRIENQFYSLIALIPLAFTPLIATSIATQFFDRRLLAGQLDWLNFGFTALGILVIAPLTYRAAIGALGPSPAPSIKPLIGVSAGSPAKETNEAIAPRFSTQVTPIIWQSIHSARGLLVITIGMLLVSFLIAASLASGQSGFDLSLAALVLLPPPLAVCWLGISVFKHDGSAQSIRFLADRGISPTTAYLGLHAVPVAILCTGMVIYGLWNTTISHREGVSSFASGMPTLAIIFAFTILIYGIAQWVSQFVRTLTLSVILAPVLCIVAVAWLTSAYVTFGMPGYGFLICAIAPFVATWLMMRRYMDSTDRPTTFFVGLAVLAVFLLVPIGFATAYVLSIPRIPPETRAGLLAEANQLAKQPHQFVSVSMSGIEFTARNKYNPLGDRVKELETDLSNYSFDPQRIVQPLRTKASAGPVFAYVQPWQYRRWHGGLMTARIAWRQESSEANWDSLARWLDASSTLLPALRNSTILTDQELADRLEVLLIDTLKSDVPAERRDDDAVKATVQAFGTPASRAKARRKAVLLSWRPHRHDEQYLRQTHYTAFQVDHHPQGLLYWMDLRLYESFVAAMLEGIDSAANHTDSTEWRRKLHQIHQPGGVFETSRYSDSMRSRPAIETMRMGSIQGFGQLWGRDWEYEDASSLVASSSDAP